MSGRFSTEYLSPSRWSPSHWARGLAWPILERLGRLDSGSNPDGPIQAFSIRNRLLALGTEAIHLSSLAHQCGRPQMVSEMLVALSAMLKGGDA